MGLSRRWGLWLALLLVLLAASAAAEENLLINPGFEERGEEGLPAGWETEAYFGLDGYTLYGLSAETHEGSYSAMLQNLDNNDARYYQTVEVEPEELYRLSGWIRAEGITPTGEWGANLSVKNLYVHTEAIRDTEGSWRYVELYGETGPGQTEVTVCARLGGYSGEVSGKAWFDDLSLVRVEEIPGDTVAELWFSPDYDWGDESWEETDWDEDMDEPQRAAWPMLVGIAAGFVLIALLLWANRNRFDRKTEEKAYPWFWTALMLLAGLAVRLWVGIRVEGYPVDISCFTAWGERLLSVGTARFYQEGVFCDYPPAYMLVLGLGQLCARALGGGRAVQVMMIKLPAMLADLGIAVLAGREARRRHSSRFTTVFLTALLALNPLMILNSAAWGQIDSVLTLLLVLVAILAMRGQWQAVLPVYVLAVLTKPQALMLGFLGLAAIVVEAARNPKCREKMLIGLGASAWVAAGIIVPFAINHQPGWLIQIYSDTLSSYPYATVNASNLNYLLGANWKALTLTASPWADAVLALLSAGWGAACWLRGQKRKWKLPGLELSLCGAFFLFFLLCIPLKLSWRVMGIGSMALAFAVVLPLWLRSTRLEDLSVCGALLFLVLFALGIKMHERYLFPAIAFLALAFAIRRDWRLLLALLLVSAAMLVNVGIPLDNALRLGSESGHLNSDTAVQASAAAIINLLAMGLTAWAALDLCDPEGPRSVPLRSLLTDPQPARPDGPVRRDPLLHWRKLDTLLILGITLSYSAVGLWNLGSTRAPQTFWTSSKSDEQVILDLGARHEDFSMLYYCGVSYRPFTVAVSDDGKSWSEEYWAQMDQGQCFRWKYLVPSYAQGNGQRTYSSSREYGGVQLLSGRYVRISAQQTALRLGEVIFRETVRRGVLREDEETGETVAETLLEPGAEITVTFLRGAGGNPDSPYASSGSLTVDEPGTCEGDPGWFNSTYFDEIYHARTGYEHLHGMTPYENTHPPLGKLLMALCIGIFGMTPFGWRLAGCLAGIAMVPVMYLMGKQLTKKTVPAAAAALMIALDCMHYTQTRIATIDSFPVLFILLACFFMLRFIQRDLRQTERSLADLACSGFFMGCACASKWIGIYAGVGLAVMYFWALAREIRATKPGPERSEIWRIILLDCAACLVFFILVPAVLYLLCYIPYFAAEKPQSLGDLIRMTIEAQQGMLNYHSTPGLGMDHPFYSPWYEWPLIVRPMYYAMSAYTREGYNYSIFCFGNPAVWYVGLAGVGYVVWRYLLGHRYTLEESSYRWHLRASGEETETTFLLIGLLAQFLPWVLVPRGTYIYHYFASVPFLILCTMWLLHRLMLLSPVGGQRLTWGYLAVCLAFFVILFPYASGVEVPVAWLDFCKNFLHLYYA